MVLVLAEADNRRLIQVGAGTPMGTLLRRYWHPIAALSELEARRVMKVRLLGEDLVLFRDKKGALGLVGDRCAHRGASLALGIPDEGGLRCAYHGWLYDTGGRAVDMPLEGPSCPLRGKVSVSAYPVEALGGLVFAYLGPEPRPAVPRWDLLVWPNAIRQIGSYTLRCNWLNAVENGLDPMHNHFLHGYFVRDRLVPDGVVDAKSAAAMRIDHNIQFRYVDAAFERKSYGLLQTFRVARADAGVDDPLKSPLRIYNNVVFPYTTRKAGTVRTELQIRVPVDDVTTAYYAYQAYIPPPGFEVPAQPSVPAYAIPIEDERGLPRLDHVMGQDAAIWTSQGAIADRSQEHLVRSDAGVILYRKLLSDQIDEVLAGREPLRADVTDERVDFEPGCVPDGKIDETRQGYDTVYHDRFGPMIEPAMDLVRRVRAAVRERGEASPKIISTGK